MNGMQGAEPLDQSGPISHRCDVDVVHRMRATASEEIANLDALCERITLQVDGRHMVWRTVGKGQNVLLLHGGHGTWLHWARVIPLLSSKYKLWIPDMPGYGETTLTPAGGLQGLVSQMRFGLDALIDAKTPISIGGFSFGGLVGAQLANQREMVERLVLIGPAGHGGARRQETTPLPWRHLNPIADPIGWAERMQHNLLSLMLHNEKCVDGLALEIHWRSCLAARFHSKPFSRSGALVTALQNYAGKTLEIWAEHDLTVDPQNWIGESISMNDRSVRYVVDSAGHWLMHENPAEAARLMHLGLERA